MILSRVSWSAHMSVGRAKGSRVIDWHLPGGRNDSTDPANDALERCSVIFKNPGISLPGSDAYAVVVKRV